jgi:RNA polymerase sigma-70 factor (sigma-E family)
MGDWQLNVGAAFRELSGGAHDMTWYMEGDVPVYEGSERVTNAETFEDLYARDFAAVVGLAYALSGSRAGAEDLAQEAFLAAHRSWDRVGGYDDPGAWVRRVVANLSVSAFRRRLAEAKALTSFAIGSARALPKLSDDDAEIWRTVRTLPRRQRQVIALRYLEDMPVAQIALVLGTAEGTVRKHLHDGRLTLARRLGLEDSREP